MTGAPIKEFTSADLYKAELILFVPVPRIWLSHTNSAAHFKPAEIRGSPNGYVFPFFAHVRGFV
jgi:hypothetical protein